jgi:hypothetical protein
MFLATLIPDALLKWVDSVAGFGALIGALPILFAFAVQFFSRFAVRRDHRALAINVAEAIVARRVEPDWELDTRLSEARDALRRQEISITWNRRTMNALTFSQYIIGGVLASSFVQTQLTKETVGFLGVLVLVSSLIHQRYRPDIKYRNGKQRAAQLRAAIRKAEDAVFDARTQKKGRDAIPPIRQLVSEGLNQLEAAELNDLDDAKNENV